VDGEGPGDIVRLETRIDVSYPALL